MGGSFVRPLDLPGHPAQSECNTTNRAFLPKHETRWFQTRTRAGMWWVACERRDVHPLIDWHKSSWALRWGIPSSWSTGYSSDVLNNSTPTTIGSDTWVSLATAWASQRAVVTEFLISIIRVVIVLQVAVISSTILLSRCQILFDTLLLTETGPDGWIRASCHWAKPVSHTWSLEQNWYPCQNVQCQGCGPVSIWLD